MRRITDDQATAILTGATPGDGGVDPDVALLVAELRSAYRTDSAPQPSSALSSYLDPSYLSQVLDRNPAPAMYGRNDAGSCEPGRGSAIKRLVGRLAGLGLAWQVGLGATAACAAVAGAGAAHVLPDPAQQIFDSIVTTVTPFERTDDTPDQAVPEEDSATITGVTGTPARPSHDEALDEGKKERGQDAPPAETKDSTPSAMETQQDGGPSSRTEQGTNGSGKHRNPDQDDEDEDAEDREVEEDDRDEDDADNHGEDTSGDSDIKAPDGQDETLDEGVQTDEDASDDAPDAEDASREAVDTDPEPADGASPPAEAPVGDLGDFVNAPDPAESAPDRQGATPAVRAS